MQRERSLQPQVGRGSAAAVSLSFGTAQEMNNAFPILHGRKLRWQLGRPLALLPQLTLPQGGVGARRVTCVGLLGVASGSSWQKMPAFGPVARPDPTQDPDRWRLHGIWRASLGRGPSVCLLLGHWLVWHAPSHPAPPGEPRNGQ